MAFPHVGPGGVNANQPMAPCLALLKAFDKGQGLPQQAIAGAHEIVSQVLGQRAMADLSDGQLAALVDMVLELGRPAFVASKICAWVKDGNLTLPPRAMVFGGPRGMARCDVWNIGNSA